MRATANLYLEIWSRQDKTGNSNFKDFIYIFKTVSLPLTMSMIVANMFG